MRSINIACGLLSLALLIGCSDSGGGDGAKGNDTTATAPESSGGTGSTAGASGSDQSAQGSQAFQGSSTGAVDAPSMSGDAAFWTTKAEGMQFWVLNLYPKGAGEGRISFTRMKKSRPEAGEYQVGEEDLEGNVFGVVYVPADPSTSVKGMKGKLTLATSTSDKVTGSFEFEGLQANMKNLSEPGKPVTMKGTFTATCIGQQATGNVCE